jgi:hypothetical protein
MVIDILLGQITSLWSQWMKEVAKGVVTPNGTPAGVATASQVPQDQEPPETPQETPQVIDEGPYPGEKVQ